MLFNKNQLRNIPRRNPTPRTIQTAVSLCELANVKKRTRLRVTVVNIPTMNTVTLTNLAPKISKRNPIIITIIPHII